MTIASTSGSGIYMPMIGGVRQTAGASASSGMSESTTPGAGAPLSARDEFLKFQSMTPAQKMRAMMLAKLGVTEEQLKAMSPEERAKIEEKMKDMVKQQFAHADEKKDRTGVLADIKA